MPCHALVLFLHTNPGVFVDCETQELVLRRANQPGLSNRATGHVHRLVNRVNALTDALRAVPLASALSSPARRIKRRLKDSAEGGGMNTRAYKCSQVFTQGN